jgi:nucleotidyltransferase-like protein
MLPVVDRPLIQHVVDEARQAGIEHFIFVTGRNKAVIEDHFDRQYELELTLTERKRKADLELLSRDLPGAGQTSFTRQQSPLGLGHAVWCARELVGREPFALLLPDVLVQAERGCLARSADAAPPDRPPLREGEWSSCVPRRTRSSCRRAFPCSPSPRRGAWPHFGERHGARSLRVVRFCAPADNEVAATSIAANVSDLTMLYLLGAVPAPKQA